jgi:hypothetical protein
MKITMIKTMKGANSALGNASIAYVAGQTYDMSADWQQSIANAFIDAGGAKLSDIKEKKVVEPTETQAVEDAPKKKSKKKA